MLRVLQLFEKASKLGNPNGIYQLGMLYEYGRGGVPQDFEKAASYYSRAADEVLTFYNFIIIEKNSNLQRRSTTWDSCMNQEGDLHKTLLKL